MGIKISIADVLATFGEVSLWRIEDMMEDNIRLQMNKAIFTCMAEIDVRCHCAHSSTTVSLGLRLLSYAAASSAAGFR